MKHDTRSPVRIPGGFLAVAAILAAGPVLSRAQTPATPLAPLVVAATRLPESSTEVGTSVEVVSGADLAREQLVSLADVLAGMAGAPVFATGQSGASASVFFRGANSNQTLFLIDGIRSNDANADYGPFIAGLRIFRGDTVEAARGPQSTLYGSEAVGGVVAVSAAPGSGSPSGTVSAEAGSFGSVDGVVTAQGASGSWAYNLGMADSHTDNDRVNNAFTAANARLRIDYDLSPAAAVGATVRGLRTRYGDPSDEYTDNPYDYETESNWLGTVFADVRPNPDLSSHLTLGAQHRDYDAFSEFRGSPPSVTHERDRRGVADWQIAWRINGSDRLLAGATAEDETVFNDGYGDIDRRQTLAAFYAEDELTLPGDVHLTGGLRHDDYNTFGAATTGRLTAAWLLAGRALKLRASYGTGFNQPSLLDLYGVADGYMGNPALKPERSRGWDAGLDYYVPGNQGLLSATWFQNDFENLIEFDFDVFPGTTVNVEKARTRGLELALQSAPDGRVRLKAALTRLESEDLIEQTPLLRRPHYTASVDLWSDLGHGISLGAGGTWVGIRADVDAQTFATVNDPGYDVARVYAAWKATSHLTLKARLENALDRRYEPVNGYPALPRGIYGGLEWAF